MSKYLIFVFTDLDRKLLRANINQNELSRSFFMSGKPVPDWQMIAAAIEFQQQKPLHFSAIPMPRVALWNALFSFEIAERVGGREHAAFTSRKT
jgi:hypothetical protein